MIIIIPCGGKKAETPSQAVSMYLGPYFKGCLAYALSIALEDDILILSAKYGLLDLTIEIEPYELRMGQLGCVTHKEVMIQAEERGILGEREVVALGGKDYTQLVKKVWPYCITPLEGVGGIGKQLAWLKKSSRPISLWG